MPMGAVSLSARLYAPTRQTAAEVSAIVRTHAQGAQQARELGLRMYDGYSQRPAFWRTPPGRGYCRANTGASATPV